MHYMKRAGNSCFKKFYVFDLESRNYNSLMNVEQNVMNGKNKTKQKAIAKHKGIEKTKL